MRKAVIGSAVVLATSLALSGGAVAGSGSHAFRGLRQLKVHTSKRHVCAKTFVNGINDKGTLLGTTYCGGLRTFVRTAAGHTKFYSLPKKYARITLGSNIASDGTLALTGQKKKNGRSTGYLVAPGGKITVVRDPLAGTHSTFLNGVNSHGAAVGDYCLNHKCSKRQAFIYRRGNFNNVTMRNPKRVLPDVSEITDSGALIGTFYQAPSGYRRGFVQSHGKVHLIDAPGGGRKLGQGTVLLAGSNRGAVCGFSFGAHHHIAGFVRRKRHNDVESVKPGVRKAFTEVTACTDSGEIAIQAKLKHGVATYLARVG